MEVTDNQGMSVLLRTVMKQSVDDPYLPVGSNKHYTLILFAKHTDLHVHDCSANKCANTIPNTETSLLVSAGADVNARSVGKLTTPLIEVLTTITTTYSK